MFQLFFKPSSGRCYYVTHSNPKNTSEDDLKIEIWNLNFLMINTSSEYLMFFYIFLFTHFRIYFHFPIIYL